MIRSIKGDIEKEDFITFKILCLKEELNHPDGFKRAVDVWINSK